MEIYDNNDSRAAINVTNISRTLVTTKLRNNIALGKPTKQLTTYNQWTSEHAVDGNYIEFPLGVYSCTHSNDSLTSELTWWAVDLEGHYKVTHVVIYGRQSTCCSKWLQNYDIDVIEHSKRFGDKWATFQKGRTSLCHYQQPASSLVNATCPPDVKGRFVRIKRRHKASPLCLCEVEVYGELITNMTVARRVPLAYAEAEKEAIIELQKKGIIRESSSPWASPIVLVKKKNGKMRPCIDFRRVNLVTRNVSAFPLPRITDCINAVAGSTFFSSLDLTSSYYQIPVKKQDIQKTAFCTKYGHFEFLTMPMGLNGSAATFQRTMELILYR
ncbi:unnamed protein product [Mytilus edulis]|uniref:Reverse transcriptase domain-containing protein n=1 Tax=Mytilus edulis TaxID=6550 RepID=A0A8S3ST66_MYTED|nr:unnamed protein product [Mytilus edulis]